MACIPARPIIAEDPLAYFVPIVARPVWPAPPLPVLSALDQMYGYYNAA